MRVIDHLPNDDLARMREYVRFRIAFYCSTRAYWAVLEGHGLEELGLRLRTYPKAQRWDEMAALIDDEVLSLFATVATHESLAGALEARYGGLVDTLSLFIPPHTDPLPLREAISAVQRVPIPFRGYPGHA